MMFVSTDGFNLAIGLNQCFGYDPNLNLLARHMANNGPTNTNIRWTDTNGTVWIPRWEIRSEP